MGKRIAAIIFIYICVSIAWVALGAVMLWRTYDQDRQLRSAVGDRSPSTFPCRPTTPFMTTFASLSAGKRSRTSPWPRAN